MNYDEAMNANEEQRRPVECVVFGAGEYYNEQPQVPTHALIIAADGGMDHALRFGLSPDVVIGDFDSASADVQCCDGRDGIIRLPSEKDDTDMLAALKVGWLHNARIFHIYGGLGGRVDHTIANLQLLARLSLHGGIGYLHGDGNVVTCVTDGTLSFPAWRCDADGIDATDRMLSVFSHVDCSRHVTIDGLKYQLKDGMLRNTRPVGISNEFVPEREAVVSVGDGTLQITFPEQAPAPQWWTSREPDGSSALGELDLHVSKLLAPKSSANRQ